MKYIFRGKPGAWKANRTINQLSDLNGLTKSRRRNKNNNLFTSVLHTHTKDEAQPWWGVDLEESYDVATVRVLNRGDCCGMSFEFMVLVSDVFGLIITISCCCDFA